MDLLDNLQISQFAMLCVWKNLFPDRRALPFDYGYIHGHINRHMGIYMGEEDMRGIFTVAL